MTERRSKYNARKVTIDGHTFASAKEAERYQELRLLEKAGEISRLECQVKYTVDIGDHHICNYYADFHYRDWRGWLVVEDVKGYRTPVYRLKKKLVEALYGIEITEV